jgi:hypothetical protein
MLEYQKKVQFGISSISFPRFVRHEHSGTVVSPVPLVTN